MRRVIVVGDEAPAIARGLARPSEVAAVACRSTAEAWDHARTERPDALVILAGPTAEERASLIAGVAERWPEGPPTIAVAADLALAEGERRSARVDLALHPDLSSGALSSGALSSGALAAALATSLSDPPPDPALLAGITTLREDDDAFRHAADLLARAFGTAGAVISLEAPRLLATAGASLEGYDPGAIVDDLRVAARVGTLVVGAAGGLVRCLRAVPIPGLVGTVALVDEVPRRLTSGTRRALEAVATRLGEELRWRSAHARLISELDAARANDGLDPLMGIWSRTAFMRLVDGIMGYARRHDLPVTLGVIDVVGMAAINERAGYEIGDGVLRHLAEVARYVMRGEDIIGRLGGDSLVLAFIGTPTERAAIAIERLQNALAGDPITDGDGKPVELTTVAGLAVIHDGDDAERAARRASDTARQALSEGHRLLTGTHVVRSGPDSSLALPIPHAGTTVGGLYRVTHEVGSGGGGSVYRGIDLGLRRPVAIKMLRPELARDAAALERFREEAATLAALRHPNLVQIYAAGVDSGVPYFVMEMVEGETVSQAIDRCIRERHTLPLRQVRSTVEQVAAALDALHSRGIVHRDVKPANILVDPFRRRTVLVDVGVARRHGDRQDVAGTPIYLPPEGFYAIEPQPSFDLFSFAVTVFEMLALELPWAAEETIAQTELTRRTVAPRPLSQYRPDLALLDRVFVRGLEVEPELRWRSVAEFAEQVIAGIDQVMAAESAQPASLTGVSFESPDAPDSLEHVTRGVVFRSLARVVGARAANRWRMELGRSRPDLAALLSSASEPLAWHPTRRLAELLESAPEQKSASALAAELGRATVRATFRRFFPASAVTLTPASTLEALDVIWKQYQSWGRTEIAQGSDDRAIVRLFHVPDDEALRGFARGMLEQLVTLSGGREVAVVDRADDACWAFELSWIAPDPQGGVVSSSGPADSGSVPSFKKSSG